MIAPVREGGGVVARRFSLVDSYAGKAREAEMADEDLFLGLFKGDLFSSWAPRSRLEKCDHASVVQSALSDLPRVVYSVAGWWDGGIEGGTKKENGEDLGSY